MNVDYNVKLACSIEKVLAVFLDIGYLANCS